MKTLPSNVSSNYLKQGNKPRVLVSVADARDGTVEGRFWASQSYTTADGNVYSDRITSARTIHHTIEPFGGMSAVSGTNLSILKADSDIKFYQGSALDTTPHPAAGEGHGRLIKSNSVYATARITPADSLSNSAITVGQYKGITNYNVYRGFLQFFIPTLASVEDAYITLEGDTDSSSVDFEIYLYEGTWNNATYGVNMFQSYNATQLNETFETGTGKNFTTSGSNYIRFNRAGRDLIKNSYSGTTLRLMLVSKEDVDSSQPGEGIPFSEFVKFTPSVIPTLTLQYNTVKPDNRTATIYIGYADSSGDLPDDEDDMLQLWTGVVDKYTLDPAVFDMQLRHDDFRHNLLVPPNLIDETTFPDSPNSNIGVPIPIVIGKASELTTGNHKMGIGLSLFDTEYQDGIYNHFSGYFDYFPSFVVDPGGDGLSEPINTVVSTKDIQKVWNKGWIATWLSDVNAYGRYVSLATQTGTVVSSTLTDYVTAKIWTDKRFKPDTDKEGGANPASDSFKGWRGTSVSIIPDYIYDFHNNDGYNPNGFITDEGATLSKNATLGERIYAGFNNLSGSFNADKIEAVWELDTGATNAQMDMSIQILDKLNLATGSNGTLEWINGGQSYLDSVGATFQADGISAGNVVYLNGMSQGWIIDTVTNETRLKINIFGLDQSYLDSLYGATGIDYIVSETNTSAKDYTENDWNGGVFALDVTTDIARPPESYIFNVGIDPAYGTTRTKKHFYYPQIRYYLNDVVGGDTLLKLYSDKYGEHGTIASVGDTLYEIPSDVIRALVVNYGGLDNSTEIDDDSFNDAQTDLTNWVFGFQLPIDDRTQKQLFTYAGKKGVIHELAEQCKSSVFFDHEGKLKIKVFDATDPFPNSGTNVPDDLDIFEYSGSPSSDSFTKHGIVPGSYRIDIMDIDKVFNDYTVKYNLRYGDHKYIKTVYMDHGDGTDTKVSTNIDSDNLESSSTLAELKLYTSGAYTALNNKINILVYEAWAIRQKATAIKFLQSLIEWHSRRRYIVEFDTYFSAIAFEEADFINIRTPDIEDTFGTATMNSKKWKIIEYSPNLGNFTIHIKAIEAEIY